MGQQPQSLFKSLFTSFCKRAAGSILDIAIAPQCAICGMLFHALPGAKLSVCGECAATIQQNRSITCKQCGFPGLGVKEVGQACQPCRKSPPHWNAAVFLGAYEGELRHTIIAAKYHQQHHLLVSLGAAIAGLIPADWQDEPIDAVVPIPMHWTRKVARGENPPDLLAESIARRLRAPLMTDLLRRQVATQPQEGLSRAERRDNVRGAFALGKGYILKGARVILVDDVSTSGATCDEAARILKRRDASWVGVAVVAKTLLE